MANTTQLYIHIVLPAVKGDNQFWKDELYKYIAGIVINED
jgi:hypothetical protein